MDEQALDLTKRRKEKSSAQLLKVIKIVGEPRKRNWTRILGDPRSLGSSGRAARPCWD